MADNKSFKQQAEEAAELLKKVGGETADAFKNSGAGKEIFGEDGKFDKEDAERLKNDAGTQAGKIKQSVVGEDGKFGDDDKARIKKNADALAGMAKDDVSKLFEKK